MGHHALVGLRPLGWPNLLSAICFGILAFLLTLQQEHIFNSSARRKFLWTAVPHLNTGLLRTGQVSKDSLLNGVPHAAEGQDDKEVLPPKNKKLQWATSTIPTSASPTREERWEQLCTRLAERETLSQVHLAQVLRSSSVGLWECEELLLQLGQRQKVPAMAYVLEHMRTAGIAADQAFFNKLLDFFSKKGQLPIVKLLTASMESIALRFTAGTYRAMILVHVRNNQWQQAVQTLQDMRNARFIPSIKDYTAVISTVGKVGKWKLALQVFQDIDRVGLSPDIRAYTAIIDALWRAGQDRLAFQTYGQMQRRGLMADRFLFAGLMTVCARSGQWRAALQLFYELHQQGVTPDLAVYNALISALGKGG
eukprot:EG_transcript_16913